MMHKQFPHKIGNDDDDHEYDDKGYPKPNVVTLHIRGAQHTRTTVCDIVCCAEGASRTRVSLVALIVKCGYARTVWARACAPWPEARVHAFGQIYEQQGLANVLAVRQILQPVRPLSPPPTGVLCHCAARARNSDARGTVGAIRAPRSAVALPAACDAC